ncbi:MAG: sulfurtransferase-like selenium metabolism protein YedF [Anaerovorax sp.]
MGQTINARGWTCPKPIIETKRLLDTMEEGQVTTIVDNQAAVSNLITFSENSGYSVAREDKEDAFFITITKEPSEEAAQTSKEGNLVIQISGNEYGTGTGDLGENLMKAYLYALTEVTPRPSTILFINSGVLLTTEGSEVLDSLKTLEGYGVELLSCGACLNFYGLEGSLQVGQVTNMYTMVERMHHATNAIKI